MTNKIIVNASALRTGGATTILQQFVKEVPDDNVDYLVFVDESVKLYYTQKNIQLVHVKVHSFVNRFYWDLIGLNNWIRRHKINPLATISLQNTNFRLHKPCPNYIYYHQSIPIYKHKWSALRKNERRLWFYKYVYPFFIKLLINSRTEIFVQLEFIKEGFSRRFKFDKNKIHIAFPTIEIPEKCEYEVVLIDDNAVNLFYPADSYPYKNHRVIFDALAHIDSQLNSKIVLYLTIASNEFNLKNNFENIDIVYLDRITHDRVIWMYNHVDALVFPSYIETLGLPLIEAASIGLPVIAADLPYSREVLKDYNGVTYVGCQDVKGWSNEFIRLSSIKTKKFEPLQINKMESWPNFFRIIKSNLLTYNDKEQ